jgi:predicted N-acetyltransferase YhbS
MFRSSLTTEKRRACPLKIRSMRESDLPAADRLLQAAFARPSSFVAHARLTIELQPDGVLVAEDQGKLLGTVGAVDYGRLAYIGLMAVDPARQSAGIGRAIMDHLLAWLDERGCPMALLDATDRGALLYEKLGFVDDATAFVYELLGEDRARRSRAATNGLSPTIVRPAAVDDLPEVIALDAAHFGADRARLHRALWDEFQSRWFVARDSVGQLVGYLVDRDPVIGPWVATSTAVAEQLLLAALALEHSRPPLVMVPRGNMLAVELLVAQGFVQQRRLRHMRRGGEGPPGNPAALYGQSSFAHG